MLHRKAKRLARRWWVPAALVVALGGGLLAQSALAASAPPPESVASCGGSLKREKPTSLDPNLLSYQFTCDWGISAYTLFVNRKPNNYSTIDDFSSSVSVFDPDGSADPKEVFACSGTIPGNGINCNAGAGSYMAAPNTAEGTIDLTDPYCPAIPKGSPTGTKPQPSPVVEIVVSDTTGAEDGPFRLFLNGKCRAPHAKSKTSKK